MTRPWTTLARVETQTGPFELRRRGDTDFLITVSGRVLMNSHASRSERALAELACQAIAGLDAPRVLIGGLGMGCTLRAALDRLPERASVEVCELHDFVARWCRGPLAEVNRNALDDPRVTLTLTDVAARIRDAEAGSLDLILLDLLEGPHARTDPRRDPFYGARALAEARRALAPGGHLAIWSEARDASYEARLEAAGFDTRRHRPGRGGLRHVVYLARAAAAPRRQPKSPGKKRFSADRRPGRARGGRRPPRR